MTSNVQVDRRAQRVRFNLGLDPRLRRRVEAEALLGLEGEFRLRSKGRVRRGDGLPPG